MGALVFVSTELHPWTKGAVGHAMHDMLRALPASDRTRTVLMLLDCGVDPAWFESEFPGIRLVVVDTSVDTEPVDARRNPPATAYSTAASHWHSAVVLRRLNSLSGEQVIDYLEFFDLGGLAFCTLQERNLRGFLQGTTIAVRLCASHTLRMLAEAQPVGVQDLNISDLERKSLRDCDIIVVPCGPVADATRDAFDIDAREWDCRVVEHVAAAPIEGDVLVARTAMASPDQAVVLPFRLERANRADVFVRAISNFIATQPAFVGDALIDGPEQGEPSESDVGRLVPPALARRLRRLPMRPGGKREACLRASTIVVASASWDGFCSVAHEASQLGARLILNETNPAFGPGTLWRDGVNCLKFDGSVDGLVRALARNFERDESLQPAAPPVHPWPWQSVRMPREMWHSVEARPMVSVVVAHFNLGAYLGETLASVRAQSYAPIEIVVIDDASTDPQSVLAIEALAANAGAVLKVIRLPANVGLAAARNLGVRHAAGRYVLTLDADDLIHPDFVAIAVESLENRAEFDVVVTPAGYFVDGDPLPATGMPELDGYAMFCGEAVVGGLIENRFSTATAVFRRSALLRFPYLETLNCYEDWSLYMRMCEAGIRFVVSNEVFFFYRRRLNSMVHTPRDLARKRIEYNDLMRTSVSDALRLKARHLIVGLQSPVVALSLPAANTETSDARRRAEGATNASPIDGLFGAHGLYDRQIVFASLKLSRWLERRLPWLVHGTVAVARRAWGAYRALRGSEKKDG